MIRPVAQQDIKRIVEIERLSFIDPWPAQWFRSAIICRDHFMGYIYQGDILIGYALSVMDEERVHIANLAVDPDFRRQGAGAALIEEAILFATMIDAQEVFLEVRKSNAEAIRLYNKFAFQMTSTEAGFYADGEDALILARKANGLV